jgi:hypothetical protein
MVAAERWMNIKINQRNLNELVQIQGLALPVGPTE